MDLWWNTTELICLKETSPDQVFNVFILCISKASGLLLLTSFLLVTPLAMRRKEKSIETHLNAVFLKRKRKKNQGGRVTGTGEKGRKEQEVIAV